MSSALGHYMTIPMSAPGPPALDLLLKNLISSPEFNGLEEKNWTTISRMVPGTTARQCQKRYDELLKESYESRSHKPVMTSALTTNKEASEHRLSRPSSAKLKANKIEKVDLGALKVPGTRPLSADQGPVMVIHVCDEAKNLKEDFHCARDLLVSEMKYFAEYLSTDAQRWEEVDISVHCDVQIFDWLMKFVKRTSRDSGEVPKLEPTNVISILISSDFLKMDNLVEVCVEFCHQNMSAIVATPCNMNCINDKLATRIAELFTHNEADEIKDRKDKFKSKLFQKKIEKLFDANTHNACSPENATTLFRCSVCKKILTENLQGKMKCLQSRLNIDRFGKLSYSHMKDVTFDVNEYVLELKNSVKSWRDVYWRLWGHINYLTCARCHDIFPACELGHCKYHPEVAVFDNTPGNGAMGKYSCCEQEALRFDPTQNNNGCKVRDHVVTVSETSAASGDTIITDTEKVYNDLLQHRDAICEPYQRLISLTEDDNKVDVFATAEQVLGMRNLLLSPTSPESTTSSESQNKPRLQALIRERQVSCDEEYGLSEDDEIGDEEEYRGKKTRVRRSRVTVDPRAILLDAPSFSTTKTRKWDSSRSLRWNQDAQREDDLRRMKEIVSYLTKLRFNAEKIEKVRQKEYAGGLYSKLEAQWKAVNMPPPKAPNAFQYRNKPRIGAIPK